VPFTGRTPQNASAETTSDPAIEPTAHHVCGLIDVFTNRTEPSIIMTLAPPAWRLPAVSAPFGWNPWVSYSQLRALGGITCVHPVQLVWLVYHALPAGMN